MIFMLSCITTQTSADSTYQNQFKYDVTSTNNGTDYWYSYVTSTLYTYVVDNNSQLVVDVKDMSNTNSLVNVQIGNLTITDVPDSEAAENLILGYFGLPDAFGFLTSTDWEKAQNDLALQENVTSDVTVSTTARYHLQTENLRTANITITAGAQQTFLVYDATSGYLLEASSSFFGFFLNFKLGTYNINETSNSNSNSLSLSSLGLIAVFIFMTTLKYRIKNMKLTYNISE